MYNYRVNKFETQLKFSTALQCVNLRGHGGDEHAEDRVHAEENKNTQTRERRAVINREPN